jgi:hypothetical protein
MGLITTVPRCFMGLNPGKKTSTCGHNGQDEDEYYIKDWYYRAEEGEGWSKKGGHVLALLMPAPTNQISSLSPVRKTEVFCIIVHSYHKKVRSCK